MAVSTFAPDRSAESRPTVPADQARSEGCTAHEHADPRVRRTRKLLLEAFRSLIHDKPYAEISVQHITDRADVNRATFYAHYTDKQDLAISLVKTDLADAVFQTFAHKPAFNRQNLILFAGTVITFMGDLYGRCPKAAEHLNAAVSLAVQDELYTLAYRWISQGRAHAELFRGSSREAVATVIAGSVYGAAYRWIRSGRRQTVYDLSRDIVGVIVKA